MPGGHAEEAQMEKGIRIGRFRLSLRRSSMAVKCLLLVALVLCTAALLALRGAILDAKAANAAMRAEAASLEQQNAALEQNIAEADTPGGIRRIAQDELGLVDPNTTVFRAE